MHPKWTTACLILSLSLSCLSNAAFGGLHARQGGVPVESRYRPGAKNSITDVKGVKVGHVTLIKGEGPLVVGEGPVRTGVTIVVPPGDLHKRKLIAGTAAFNSNGEAAGTAWLEQWGYLDTAIALTGTTGVGAVHEGLQRLIGKLNPAIASSLPVVFECDDGGLNDALGFHMRPEHVMEAISHASSDFEEGSVGAGTGMISFDFKSGIGSASRQFEVGGKTYTVGVLVNSNLGAETRNIFRIGSLFINDLIPDLKPEHKSHTGAPGEKKDSKKGAGSIVFIVATDAPLNALQLKQLAKRSFVGSERLGALGYNGSGDFALAFSTAQGSADRAGNISTLQVFAGSDLNWAYEAVVEAAAEAVLNSMWASKTMVGADGLTVHGVPVERLRPYFERVTNLVNDLKKEKG